MNYTLNVRNRASENPDGLRQLHALPSYTPLKLVTNSTRTSITVCSFDGTPLGFVRKIDIRPEVVAAIENRTVHAYKGETSTAVIVAPLGQSLQQISQTTEKETTMTISSTITNAINTNKDAAATAAYLEAGRIANNQLVKVAAKSLPLMARGYADTVLGRLLIANAASVAAAQLRPNDKTLTKLTQSMTVAAYQEVIRNFDIESMIDSLMSSPEMKRAVDKLGAGEQAE